MLIKLRANIPEILFGALLAVAIFAIGMLFGSSQQAPSHQQHQTQNNAAKSQPRQQHGSPLWGHSDPGVTAATVLLFLVGIAQAIMFYVQLRYMREGVRDARIAADAARDSADAFASAERPHLLVSQLNASIYNTWMPGEEEPVELPVLYAFEIRNFGRSPAFITGTVFQFHCGELPPVPVYETLRPDKNIVVPGHFFRSGTMQVIGKISHADQKRVRDDEIPIFIYGIVQYKSIFEGRTHKLRFCYRLAFGQSVKSGGFYPDGHDSYWEYS